MNNLPRETEALAKRLAAVQGLSVEDTIRQALEARAPRLAGSVRETRYRPQLRLCFILDCQRQRAPS